MNFWNWLKSLFMRSPAPVVEPPTPKPIDVARPADLPASNHYASNHPSQDRAKLEAEYRYLWSIAGPKDERWKMASQEAASWMFTHKAQFQEVELLTSIPWAVVAVINIMEMGMNFDGTILNGDPWNKVTRHYPSGKGPWKSWREAAVLGLMAEASGWNFNLKTWNWDVGGVFFFCEAYNGFNERMEIGSKISPANAPPYIYSGTQFYSSGKKIEVLGPDGKYHGDFDVNKVSDQCGVMLMLKALSQREAIIK